MRIFAGAVFIFFILHPALLALGDPGHPVRVRVNWRGDAFGELLGAEPHNARLGEPFEPTSLRQARVLSAGPAGCTLDVECRDDNPCTIDRCLIEPGAAVGSGTCQHDDVADGEPGNCDDGLTCNGREACAGGTCQLGVPVNCCDDGAPRVCSERFAACSDDSLNADARCTTHAECPQGRCDYCRPDCRARTCSLSSANPGAACSMDSQCPGGECRTNDEVCDDGNVCNGSETCDLAAGVCAAGENPCGTGAVCHNGICDGGDADNKPCRAPQDCPAGACIFGPAVCTTGRCCSEGPQPACTFAPLAACVGDWYPGDLGFQASGLLGTGHCGGQSSEDPPEPWGCPIYSSGITHSVEGQGQVEYPVHTLWAGPVSLSPQTVMLGNFSGPLTRLGDDYSIVDGSYFGLDALRFVGGISGLGRARLVLEFYDADGRFIEDAVLPELPMDSVGVPRVIVVEFQPELVLPPAGYVVFGIAESYTPHAAFFLMATDDVDVGDNNANLLWVNGGPAANPLLVPGRLALEMVGDATVPPISACCNAASGLCETKPAWVCRNENGIAHLGVACAQCINGANAGASCRSCQGGGEPGDFACGAQADCDARELGGMCLPNQDLCGSQGTCSNDNGRLCTASPDCVEFPGRCSDSGRVCAVDVDCPGGTCGGAGACLPTECEAIECGAGACCDPSTGVCSEGQSSQACAVAGGEFLGYGSTCDPDCCTQPESSGADQPAAATVHPIAVPAAGTMVLTITGNNAAASSTSAAPDTCFGPAESAWDEKGWWEAFEIDACADVRLDFCCSAPSHEPTWAFLAADATCSGIVAPATPADLFGQEHLAYGEPYCADGNAWQWYSHLPAGTYYVPIVSTAPASVGPYQLHIWVSPCLVAACCLPDGSCAEDMRFDECDAAGGVFAGPPQKAVAVTECATGLCDVGSCCLGPGACRDARHTGGTPMTKTTCESAPFMGTFTPNAQCGGGRCSGNFAVSCTMDSHCVAVGAGQCEGDAEQLTRPDPCRVCTQFDDPHCRREGTQHYPADSSTTIPTTLVDDVLIHQSGILTSICVTGTYVGSNNGDCYAQAGADEFAVAVYALDTQAYLPGAKLGEYATIVQTSRPEAEISQGRRWFDYQLTLVPRSDSLPFLDAGQVYFIQISNSTPGGSDSCGWAALEAHELGGNGLAFQNRGPTFTADDAIATDVALCMNLASTPPPKVVRACCTSNSFEPCSLTTFGECLRAKGRWQPDANACDPGRTCPMPVNDLCTNALAVHEGPVSFDNARTGTDGPTQEMCGGDFADILGADLWYSYQVGCNGSVLISTCNADYSGDEIISIYHDASNPTACPCPGDSGFQLLKCQNGGQPNHVNPLGCRAQGHHADVVLPSVTAGSCYTVRVSGAGGAAAAGELRITCGGSAVCGNGIVEALNGEECDGVSAPACPGQCQSNCLCPTAICGDGLRLGEEQCDGPEDTSCGGLAGRCQTDCTCPPAMCGNGFVDQGEECDEGMSSIEYRMLDVPRPESELEIRHSAFAISSCPGQCRPAGDSAGGCTCDCDAIVPAPDPVTAEPGGVRMNRFVAVVVPASSAGQNTALRVVLTRLNRPRHCCTDVGAASCNTTPCDVDVQCTVSPFLSCAHQTTPGSPDYSAVEGKVRYVNSLNANLTCGDDGAPFNTSYKCATLGCEPEYRDWAGDLATPGPGQPQVPGLIYITGDAVVPSSVLEISHIAASCGPGATANTCSAASTPFVTGTPRWSDITGPAFSPPDGKADVLDLPAVVNKLKAVPTFFLEPRTWLKQRDPAPHADAVTVIDLSDVVDGGPQAKSYPASRTIDTCGHD